MRHLRVGLVLLLVASVYVVPSLAQDKSIIVGRVLDQYGNGLSGVTVLLHNDALNTTRTATTARDGSYLFEGVTPAGGFKICIPEIASKDKKAPSNWCVPSVKFKNNPLQNPLRTEVQGATRALPSFIQLPASAENLGDDTFASQVVETPGGGSIEINTALLASSLSLHYGGTQDIPSPSGASSGQSTPPSAGGTTSAASARTKTGKAPVALSDSVIYSTVPLDYYSTSESSVISGGGNQINGLAEQSASGQGVGIPAVNELRELPFFNRNFLVLGLLAPSTHDVPAGSELQDATFSISGQRPNTNLFLLDGMDNTAAGNHQAIPFQVNDAIQEFRVVTATADAQFGNTLGGIVNVVTQRGGTQFHGSLFGYFASSSLDASSPLSVYGGSGFDQAAAFAGPVNAQPVVPKGTSPIDIYEPLNYNQYVATVQSLNILNNTHFCTAPNTTYGSPACLQRFDPAAILATNDSRNQPFSSQQFGGRAGGAIGRGPNKKWFWFGDYEGTRIDNPNPIFERVPSAYDKTQWSNIFTTPGQQGYSDAKLAQHVLALYPQSNVQAIPNVLEFYRGLAPNYTNVSNYLGRIDFDQSEKTSWNARYNLQQLSQLHDDFLPSSQTYPGNGAVRDALNQNAVLTLSHELSSGVTNVLRGGFTRFQVTETPQDATFDESKLGLPSGSMRTYLLSGFDPQYSGATPNNLGAMAGWTDALWLPLYQHQTAQPYNSAVAPSLDGLFPFARLGAPLSAPGQRQDSEIELVDNLTASKGKHLLQGGIQISWLQNLFTNGGFSRGFMVSSDIGEFTVDDTTDLGTGLPSFASPSFDYAAAQPAPFNTKFHSYTIGGYFQDKWRIRPNLTLNLGLRYEFFSPPSEYSHKIWNYDPIANGLVKQDGSAVLNTFGDACGTGQKNNRYPYLLYPNRSYYPSAGALLPWNCQTSGNGNFLVSSKTNFEPRVGLAWSSSSGTTVLRAGFGIFYDQMPASYFASLGFNRPTAYSQSNPQTTYDQNALYFFGLQKGLGNSSLAGIPAQSLSQPASVPFGINAIDPQHFSNPMNKQVSASVQHQVTRQLSAEAAYIGTFMNNLPVTTNTNFNNEWFCTTSRPYCDPFSFVPIFTLSNQGYGSYNAFLIRVKTNGWHGLQLQAGYTFSKALDNASGAVQPLIPEPLLSQTQIVQNIGFANPVAYSLGQNPYLSAAFKFTSLGTNPFGIGSLAANVAAMSGLLTQGLTTTGNGQVHVTPYSIPQDPYNFLANDYGRSDYDQSNRFVLEYTWNIPVRGNSNWVRGWMLSSVFVAQSGQPFTIFSGPIGGELTQRVSLTGPVGTTGNPQAYIGNLNSIVMPSSGCADQPAAHSPYTITGGKGLFSGTAGTPCAGDSARNQFTGPAYVDYDMAVQKTFKVREAMSLLFRAESYNLFNHPNYYNPISTISLDGVDVYSQFGQIKSAHNSRAFQFAARLNW